MVYGKKDWTIKGAGWIETEVPPWGFTPTSHPHLYWEKN